MSDAIANFNVTKEERRRIKQAAAANRQTASEFMRDVVLDAVSETLESDQEQAEA